MICKNRYRAPLAIIAMLAVQLDGGQQLLAASSQRQAEPTLATTGSAVQPIQRPVRPEGVATSSPVTGDEVFTERYPNGNIRVEREVALDAEDNYVNHGPYRLWSENGQLIAEGEFKMGARVGTWTRWASRNEAPLLNRPAFKRFAAPFLSQAAFVNGVAEGEWLIFDAQQRKCSQVSLQHGTRHGLAMIWAPDGTLIQQSTFERGMPQGDVLQLSTSTGEMAIVKRFLDGRQLVNKKTTFPRSKKPKTDTNFLAAPTAEKEADDFWNIRFATYSSEGEPLRHGEWKTWHANGQLEISGQYERDQKVGKFVNYYASGQIAAQGTYRNDKHEGDWVWWHANGQKKVSGTCREGALIGDWRWWDEGGHLAKRESHDGSKTVNSSDDEYPMRLGQRGKNQASSQK